jgi:hypothetical protein
MAEQRPHPLIDVLFGHRVQLTLTHDVRVVLPGRQIHRHVVGDHHQRQQDDIGIVIGEDQQHRRLQGILHHIAHGGDLQRHVVALKGGKRGVVIGEHQVIQHALRQIDGEEDVQVHIRRTLVFHQPWQKRHHRQAHAQNHQTHDAVDLPVLAAGQRPVCPQKARQHLSYHRQAERVGGGAAAAGREVPGGLCQRRPHGLRFRYGAAAADGYLPAGLPADFRL